MVEQHPRIANAVRTVKRFLARSPGHTIVGQNLFYFGGVSLDCIVQSLFEIVISLPYCG
jgi:hypothetical protein